METNGQRAHNTDKTGGLPERRSVLKKNQRIAGWNQQKERAG